MLMCATMQIHDLSRSGHVPLGFSSRTGSRNCQRLYSKRSRLQRRRSLSQRVPIMNVICTLFSLIMSPRIRRSHGGEVSLQRPFFTRLQVAKDLMNGCILIWLACTFRLMTRRRTSSSSINSWATTRYDFFRSN